MQRINSAAELDARREDIRAGKDADRPAIAVCSGAGCAGLSNGRVIAAFEKELQSQGLAEKVDLRATGCHGLCELGPNVVIYPEEIYYVHVKPEDVAEIVKETVQGKKVVDRLVYSDPASGEKAVHLNEIPFYKYQSRNLIGNNTRINPSSIDDYIGIGGYAALAKALFGMKPEQVLDEVKKANLRGRGGGGFPAGLKWETTRNAPEKEKYVIVNGHEGEPGAFMDRAVFTGNPHLVLEGLIIGAYAIGAHQGFIYTRHDSKLLKANIDRALKQARENGLLGENILGSGFDFDVEVHFDVGIFVSGESSALMRSIEGKNPEPRPKYIRTSVSGIWDKPSNLNNVETWANVPQIIEKGAEWYTGIGTERSKGTKMISLSGNIVNSGVVEVPFGTTLRQIIFDIGGGIPGGKKLKALHFGGAMGGSIPENLIDTPLDFDALKKVGAPMGAGALMVMDEDTDMVEMAKFFLTFLTNESCGKCVPCREGIQQLLKILTGICKGEGKKGDIETMEEIADVMSAASLCSLGKTATDPLRGTLKYFREEYETNIH
ncbi:NADH dehydrogenase [Desulfosarcina ovata subsp. sediminis]|uniref:NADH dehydrogenase n=1 Tax=Desulfosarcina ovata subsp. sediminis TaxID=885957 RepID=A0A5K8A0H3_9BACT|nr:NADH-ubiquinone oxidoreductase-F iron-sulfur binding region domain-containing protein [Desulfosarcina ovata]BBO86045.1 NADH dehydrogenase [Desulfosarcina ovata subsp. sediminis]